MNKIATKKKLQIVDEVETSQKEEFFHIEKKVAREIHEDVNGLKTVHEVETSTANNQSKTNSQIQRHKQIAKETIEHLNIKDPSQLMSHSYVARKRFRDIYFEKCNFQRKYKNFTLNLLKNHDIEINKKIQNNMFEDAKDDFMCAPFVDFTWEEIMNADGGFRLSDYEKILLNKLIWNAAFLKDDDIKLKNVIEDKTAIIKLEDFDMVQHIATVNLIVPSCDVNLSLKLTNIDPFLLMLIPDKQSQALVRTITQSLKKIIHSFIHSKTKTKNPNPEEEKKNSRNLFAFFIMRNKLD